MANKTHNIDLNASCVNYNNVSQGVIHITVIICSILIIKVPVDVIINSKQFKKHLTGWHDTILHTFSYL